MSSYKTRKLYRGRNYSSGSSSTVDSAAITLSRPRYQIPGLTARDYQHVPYGINYQPVELRSWADDDYVGDLPYEYWPHKLQYCDVYKRKWIGYSELHKYWKNPFGWERGLPRFSITYPHAGWRSFQRYRYVLNPPLVRVPWRYCASKPNSDFRKRGHFTFWILVQLCKMQKCILCKIGKIAIAVALQIAKARKTLQT